MTSTGSSPNSLVSASSSRSTAAEPHPLLPRPTDAWVRAIAAYGLPGGPRDLGPPPEDTTPQLQLAAVSWHRLTGLAVEAQRAGAMTLPVAQRAELLECHRRWMDTALLAEQRLLELDELASDAGIRVTVLKGPALAHGRYPDPSLRPFGDIDLLVSVADWPAASRVLAAAGAVRRLAEPRDGFDVRFGKAATHRCADGLDLDLHRTLAPGPFGLWISPDELLERTETFELGGRRLLRLDPTAAFVHACLHAALGTRPPVLMAIRDVAQLHDDPAIEWDVVAGWARRWRIGSVLRRAVALATEELGRPLSIPDEVLAIRPTYTERVALSAYVSSRRDRGGLAVATLLAIPGLRARASYLHAMLLPRRRFLESRHGAAPGAYLRRWAVAGRWTRRAARRRRIERRYR